MLGAGDDSEEAGLTHPFQINPAVTQPEQIGFGIRDLTRAELDLDSRPRAVGELQNRISLKTGVVTVVVQVTVASTEIRLEISDHHGLEHLPEVLGITGKSLWCQAERGAGQ